MTDNLHEISPPSSSILWRYLSWGLLAGLSLGVVFPLIFAFFPALFGLVSCAVLYFIAKQPVRISKTAVLWMLALAVLAFTSTLWAFNPEGTLLRATKISFLLFLSLPFLFVLKEMPDSARQILVKYLPITLIIQGIIVLIEIYYDFPLYRLVSDLGDRIIPTHTLNKHAATLIMLLPFGLFFALQGRRYVVAAVLLAVTLALWQRTDSQAAQLALIIGALAYPACRLLPRVFTAGVFAFTVLLFIVMPFIAPIAFDKFADDIHQSETIARAASMEMRLDNYDFISRKIMEKPLTGFGMDSTRYIEFDTEQKFHPSNSVMHPHSMTLQVWIEFGVIGVIFFSCFAAFLCRLIWANTPKDKSLIMTVYCTAMVFLMVSWSIWASWLVGLMFTLAGLCLFSRNEPDHQLSLESDKTFSPSK